MSNVTIPVMHCFDNNYVTPAAVAFYSMLEYANPDYNYELFVLHNGITEENQEKLKNTIKEFKNASIEFISMGDKFKDIFDKMQGSHFSKEVLYKLLVASIFPQYEKMIVADVDVVYRGDISESFLNFDENSKDILAGVKIVGHIVDSCRIGYSKNFSSEEYNKIIFCGGYLIMNLKRIREENIEAEFIKSLEANCGRIWQAEMDILNLVCYGRTKFLPLNNLICSYMWEKYPDGVSADDGVFLKEEIIDAISNPIQLHYATKVKPWNDLSCTKSEEWIKTLSKTNFLKDFLQSQNKTKVKIKKFIDIQIPIGKNRKLYWEIGKKKFIGKI